MKNYHEQASSNIIRMKYTRPAFLDQEAPPGYVAGIGRGATGFSTRSDLGGGKVPKRLEREKQVLDESKYEDAKEDDEADAIYEEIEARMAQRRKEVKIETSKKPAISDQFVDLKRSLVTVTADEWSNLPEAGDLTKRNKRMRLEDQMVRRSYAAPDTLIAGAATTDLSLLTAERSKLLGNKLDNLHATATVDASKYLEDMTSMPSSSEDVSKLKKMLLSYKKSDPGKPHGWIALARLEEHLKNFQKARDIIAEGCESCRHSEDIWLEALRLEPDNNKRRYIVTEAIQFNDENVKLWMAAVDLENDYNKKRLLRKALMSVPRSVELWKRAVSLESGEEAAKMLERATELIPQEAELWVELVNAYGNNKKADDALERALQVLPQDTKLKLLAAKRQGSKLADVDMSVDEWLKEASIAEEEGLFETVKSIITKIGDKINLLERDDLSLVIKKYAFEFYLAKTPTKFGLWKQYMSIASSNEVYSLLKQLIELQPHPLLYLIYSKELWTNNEAQEAIQVLTQGIKMFPKNVDLWLAKVKVSPEFFNDALEEIGDLTPKIWYKMVAWYRHLGKDREALDLLIEAMKRHSCDKFYLQQGQIYQDLGEPSTSFADGVKLFPQSVPLWNSLAAEAGSSIKARAILDKGVLSNPDSAELWIAKVRLETGANKQVVINQALSKFPGNVALWVEKLRDSKKSSALFQDALKQTNNASDILLFIGNKFLQDGSKDKALKWVQKAISSDAANGDAWATLYKIQGSVDTSEFQKQLPKGQVWTPIAKNKHNYNLDSMQLLPLVASRL